VVGMITPWNWPMNQIGAKLGLCLAAGNTIVLKPSEECPSCAVMLAEIMAAAGVPAGVFNLVLGDGPGVGAALAGHPQVDMISFTGSTRAGVAVAQAAAPSVKRVHQELGGKAPNIILPGVDLAAEMPGILTGILMNSGQSCTAPTRILVHQDQVGRAARLAADHMNRVVCGRDIGPVVNRLQWQRNQDLIDSAIAEGATLVAGGLGLPPGMECGFYVRPTVLADVTETMTIWREESFGPIATITAYSDLDDAVRLANHTNYGLSAVVTGDVETGRQIAPQLRAGGVCLKGWTPPVDVPFGGYKQSGNGREGGLAGLKDFMEVKAIIGG
jgi:aldehyde dehydrogenase (NAD+)